MLDVLPASPAKEKKLYLENDLKKLLKKHGKVQKRKFTGKNTGNQVII